MIPGHSWGLFCSLVVLCACEAPPSIGAEDATKAATPALRIVTLAPNLAELVYAAGAGDALVGVSAYSDFPAQAALLPVVGDAFMVDQERLLLLQPDLLLAWASGTPAHVLDKLRAAGFRVHSIRTRSLDDVAVALQRIGALTGHAATAREAATAYRQALQALAAKYASAPQIRVFYQISQQPIYTVNGEHYVSELIGICGGRNIFADLGELAPLVSVEAVLERDPEVLLAAGDGFGDTFDGWRRWPALAANRYGNHFLLPAAPIGRASPRLSVAGEALCAALERARGNRRSHAEPA